MLMAMCEACQTADRMHRLRGRRGNAANDSDADIGDKLYHRFSAVLRERPECKYCLANILPETSS